MVPSRFLSSVAFTSGFSLLASELSGKSLGKRELALTHASDFVFGFPCWMGHGLATVTNIEQNWEQHFRISKQPAPGGAELPQGSGEDAGVVRGREAGQGTWLDYCLPIVGHHRHPSAHAQTKYSRCAFISLWESSLYFCQMWIYIRSTRRRTNSWLEEKKLKSLNTQNNFILRCLSSQ